MTESTQQFSTVNLIVNIHYMVLSQDVHTWMRVHTHTPAHPPYNLSLLALSCGVFLPNQNLLIYFIPMPPSPKKAQGSLQLKQLINDIK